MNLYALFALCFIPAITFYILFCMFVPGFKIRYGLWAMLVGLFAIVPIALIQHFILTLPVFNRSTFASLIVTAFVFNGLIEETVKMLFMLLLPQKKMKLAPFFAASLLCGMMLGSFESVIYLIKRIQESELASGFLSAYALVFARMGTAVLIHTLCAGLSGLFVWMIRHKTPHAAPFVYAALLHGAYNFFAGFADPYHWFAIVAILFAVLECRIWYKYIKLPDSGVDTTKKSR